MDDDNFVILLNNIENNRISRIGFCNPRRMLSTSQWTQLKTALFANTSIVEFRLRHYDLQDPHLFEMLQQILASKKKLQRIYLHSCHINNSALAKLVNIFSTYTDLRVLSLRANGLRSNAMHVLAPLFLCSKWASSQTLDTLILRGNRLQDAAAYTLAKILIRNRSLTHLNLVSNHLSPFGEDILCAAIKRQGNVSHCIFSKKVPPSTELKEALDQNNNRKLASALLGLQFTAKMQAKRNSDAYGILDLAPSILSFAGLKFNPKLGPELFKHSSMLSKIPAAPAKNTQGEKTKEKKQEPETAEIEETEEKIGL
ncbi:MAG: hypothetical protein ACKOAD_07620 [Gammaproteobacteria bacterium]